MGVVSTHNDINKDAKTIIEVDDKKTISTRNIVPYGRSVEKKDIDNFLKKVEVKDERSVHDNKRTNKRRKR